MRWRRQSVQGAPVETYRELWGWNRVEIACKLLGHKKPYDRKFAGELLCPRCRLVVGRWS